MPLTSRRLPVVVPMMAATLAAVCVAAALWGWSADPLLEPGVSVGNKELFVFRAGFDFRVALMPPAPVFGLRADAPTAPQFGAEEAAWGRPNHWLPLPEIDFSLWWPFALSWVAVGCFAFSRVPRAGHGFPVAQVQTCERLSRQGSKRVGSVR